MIVENRGQQQSIRYVIDVSAAVWKMYGSGMKKKNVLIRNIRMNVYCVISVRWIV